MANVNNISVRIEKSARRFISDLGRADALLPVILLEAAVTGGRTYNAYDRGGFVEARERATEETLGAIFWLGGAAAFNKLGDHIGEKLLGIKDIEFDVGKDAIRNPFGNYLQKHAKYSQKTLATFKFTKVIASLVLANAIIGFVVPKINQAITRKYQKDIEKLDKRKKDIKEATSFHGAGSGQILMTLTNYFENDARVKLLSTDVGIAGGRAINARNKHERREILFRDLSSIYFYLLCRKHINNILNKLQDGKWTRLDPISVSKLDKYLKKQLTKDSYTEEEFERLVLGDRNAAIPHKVQAKIKNGLITLDDFKRATWTNLIKFSPLRKRAEAMSKLQPPLEGVSILTTEQVKDLYSKGLIDNPEFLSELFSRNTKGKSTNPLLFVSEKDLRSLKQNAVEHIESIINAAKSRGESITLESLKRANKLNLYKNAFNLTAGFAVAAYFLSTVIPRVQYWITRKQTGENKFPGIQKYDK